MENMATMALVLIMPNASPIFSLVLCSSFFNNSSVMTICASTPTPMAAMMPAMAARSMVNEPRMESSITSSARLMSTMGMVAVRLR